MKKMLNQAWHFWTGAAAAALLMIGISACTSLQVGQTAILGCTGYNIAMPALTQLNRDNKLSVSERKIVTQVRQSIGAGICEKDAPPEMEGLVREMVDAGVKQLNQILSAKK